MSMTVAEFLEKGIVPKVRIYFADNNADEVFRVNCGLIESPHLISQVATEEYSAGGCIPKTFTCTINPSRPLYLRPGESTGTQQTGDTLRNTLVDLATVCNGKSGLLLALLYWDLYDEESEEYLSVRLENFVVYHPYKVEAVNKDCIRLELRDKFALMDEPWWNDSVKANYISSHSGSTASVNNAGLKELMIEAGDNVGGLGGYLQFDSAITYFNNSTAYPPEGATRRQVIQWGAELSGLYVESNGPRLLVKQQLISRMKPTSGGLDASEILNYSVPVEQAIAGPVYNYPDTKRTPLFFYPIDTSNPFFSSANKSTIWYNIKRNLTGETSPGNENLIVVKTDMTVQFNELIIPGNHILFPNDLDLIKRAYSTATQDYHSRWGKTKVSFGDRFRVDGIEWTGGATMTVYSSGF